jgi:hypothetical protein
MKFSTEPDFFCLRKSRDVIKLAALREVPRNRQPSGLPVIDPVFEILFRRAGMSIFHLDL